MNNFSNILNTSQIAQNLSSRQIVDILNGLINATIEPLFKASSLVRELILQALLQTQGDHRRKISIHNKNVTAACIVHGVTHNNFATIKMCELDRNILFKAVVHLEPYLKDALVLERKILKYPKSAKLQIRLKNISKITGIKPQLLTPLARWCLPYLKTYLQFKEHIIAKYIKFSFQEATRAMFNTKLHVDVEELFENYLLAVSKALDKFDANRGTITSYISKWMLSAKTSPEFGHQYNVSYDLPANVRKTMENNGFTLTNMSTPMNDTHHEIEDLEMSDRVNKLHGNDKVFVKCLREIKNIKIPFLILNLPIMLKPEEIENIQGIQTV